MASWNLKELRDRTSQSLNDAEKQALSDFLDSFDWKSKATGYHLLQADECFSSFKTMTDLDITHQLLSKNDDFRLAMKIREISLVSAVMTANTLPEVLAQILNIVFLGNNFDVNGVYLKTILSRMESGELKEKYRALIEHPDYDYIKSFTNVVKHINLVRSGYRISFENEVHGVVFKSFKYKKSNFPEMLDVEIIEIVRKFRSSCLEFGVSINEAVANKANHGDH